MFYGQCDKCGERWELGTASTCTCVTKREWQGLTDQEVLHIKWSSAEDSKNTGRFEYFFARAIEAKLKEKNT